VRRDIGMSLGADWLELMKQQLEPQAVQDWVPRWGSSDSAGP